MLSCLKKRKNQCQIVLLHSVNTSIYARILCDNFAYAETKHNYKAKYPIVASIIQDINKRPFFQLLHSHSTRDGGVFITLQASLVPQLYQKTTCSSANCCDNVFADNLYKGQIKFILNAQNNVNRKLYLNKHVHHNNGTIDIFFYSK